MTNYVIHDIISLSELYHQLYYDMKSQKIRTSFKMKRSCADIIKRNNFRQCQTSGNILYYDYAMVIQHKHSAHQISLFLFLIFEDGNYTIISF